MMVRKLSVTYSSVYVISGSIFDENADGHRDDDGSITRLVLGLHPVSCCFSFFSVACIT